MEILTVLEVKNSQIIAVYADVPIGLLRVPQGFRESITFVHACLKSLVLVIGLVGTDTFFVLQDEFSLAKNSSPAKYLRDNFCFSVHKLISST